MPGVAASRLVRAPAPAPAQAAAARAREAPRRCQICPGLGTGRRRGGIGQSLSLSDIRGLKRGQEEDIPYQPWARAKTLSEKTSTGPDPTFGDTTDPQVLYCEPPGVPHIYLWPIKTKFIQTSEAVYILHELGPYYRIVWLNSKHPRPGSRVGTLDRPLRDRRWSCPSVQRPAFAGSMVTRRPSAPFDGAVQARIRNDPRARPDDRGSRAYTKPWNAHEPHVIQDRLSAIPADLLGA